ncbi:MAG: restriction endonuclease subunit S [Candidatus Competibacteraceae bacterium]|nr:restriction endonuclease subunit S [Candidatus Competibacteraceae bacterium]
MVEGENNMTGTAGQKRLPTEYFATRAFPLPPLEEQSRIVAKVDQLMALCDKLESQQQERRKLQNILRQSTLRAVACAQSSHELQNNWARLEANFRRLFSEPKDMEELRIIISELAIRGDLNESDPQNLNSNIDQLLAKFNTDKIGKKFAKINTIEEPFSLPNGWRWVLFEEILANSESGWSPKCDSESRRLNEWGVLKVSAVTWGKFQPEENKRLPSSMEPRLECEIKSGDFLLSRANTAELVARSVIVPMSCPGQLLMSDKIVRLNFLEESLKPWVNLVNNSAYAREYYKIRATGTSDSMRNVSRQVIHELPIPLPSIDVQKRILEKLDSLMSFCDLLESHLCHANQLASRFATAAVATLTGISLQQQEDDPVKIPQTELIAPLRLGAAPDAKAQAPLATILAHHNGELEAKYLLQRFGGDIDAFYAQLKTEVAHGWIQEPAVAEMREKSTDITNA